MSNPIGLCLCKLMLCSVFALLPYSHKAGASKRYRIIRTLCLLLYLVVGMFRKAQYLVLFFLLFHRFFGFYDLFLKRFYQTLLFA